jgi:hypothetical protein
MSQLKLSVMRSAFLNVIFGDINVPEDAIQKNILNHDRLTIPGGSKFSSLSLNQLSQIPRTPHRQTAEVLYDSPRQVTGGDPAL